MAIWNHLTFWQIDGKFKWIFTFLFLCLYAPLGVIFRTGPSFLFFFVYQVFLHFNCITFGQHSADMKEHKMMKCKWMQWNTLCLSWSMSLQQEPPYNQDNKIKHVCFFRKKNTKNCIWKHYHELLGIFLKMQTSFFFNPVLERFKC